MAILITLAVLGLFYYLMIKVAKATEALSALKGESDDFEKSGKINAGLFLAFMFLFFGGIVWCTSYMMPKIIPSSASNHGVEIEKLFNVTLFFTGIVFIVCHILLFVFVYKYRERKGQKAYFFAHDNRMELLWTSIPAIVMAVLVVMGLKVWFQIFPGHENLPKDRMVIEVTAKQFNWIVRYPGKDGKLGRRLITKDNITPTNELGIDWSDPASHDDFFASEIHLVKGKPVEFLLGALDVMHNFYLPHMRLKMDCVPGLPTALSFTPIKSTDDQREELKNSEEWQKLDPETGEPRWKSFKFELACAELCGRSHFGMQMDVKVDNSMEEYTKWMLAQKPIYTGTETTPKSEAVPTEAKSVDLKLANGVALTGANMGGIEQLLITFIEDKTKQVDKTTWFNFDRLLFETGKDKLIPSSEEQLKNVTEILKAFPAVNIKLGGYTDNVGKPEDNLKLSTDRANAVKAKLVANGIATERIEAEGYGQEHPVASNDTPEGRQQNRRISIRVTKK